VWAKGLSMNSSIEISKNNIEENISPPVSGVEVLGTSKNEFGKTLIVAKSYAAEDYKSFTFDPVNLIKGSSRDLAKILVGKGVVSPITQNSLLIQKDIVNQLEFKKENIIVFLEAPGTHQCLIGEKNYTILVVNGYFYLPRPLPNGVTVVLVGEANKKHFKKANYQSFLKEFSDKLAAQPRVLLVILFALTSYWWPVFGVPTLALMLVGKTSTGKSVSQRLASQLLKGTNKMISGNFTAIGLHDELADQGTQPVFIEDGHGKTVAQAMLSAFMDTGNSAHRVRSKKSQYGKEPAKPVTATLIVSAEQNIAETAKEAKVQMQPGVASRVFEIFDGEYGMFDQLCGFNDGASLAAYFDKVGAEHSGVLGDLVTQSICEKFQFYQQSWEDRKSDIARHISKYVETEVDWDGQDKRLFNGLVFCAYIGQIASKENHLLIKNKDINAAIGKVFGEYLSRKYSSFIELTSEIKSTITAVRNALKKNIRKIKKPQNSIKLRLQLKSTAIIGFYAEEKDGHFYLIKPEFFQEIMGDRLSRKTYQHLKEAGFLKVSAGRGHQYQKRLSDEHRASFVAISADIMNELPTR